MYLQLLKLINPKFAAIVVAITLVFTAGWMTNGLRYKAKIEQHQAAMLEDYAKQRAQYLRQYQTQQKLDEQAAKALTADLDYVRQQRRVIEKELLTATVVKPDDEICTNSSGGNPFGADFARLWNTTAATN
jgi:hypothetical protein